MIKAPHGVTIEILLNPAAFFGRPELEPTAPELSYERTLVGPCEFEWQGDTLVIVAAAGARLPGDAAPSGPWHRRVYSIPRERVGKFSIIHFGL